MLPTSGFTQITYLASFKGFFSRANKLPGGLIQEHDRRVVDELQADGQSPALTSREAVGASLCTAHQAKSCQDIVHLSRTHTHTVSGTMDKHFLETFAVASLTSFFFTCMLSFSFRLAEA